MNNMSYFPSSNEFYFVIDEYEKSPSPRMLAKSIHRLELILQSLAPLSQKVQALDAFGNAVFMRGRVLESTMLEKVMLFFEKYALIFDLSFFINKLGEILFDYEVKPFQTVRFQIYDACDVKGLNVADIMIEDKINAYSHYSYWTIPNAHQKNLDNLHHLKALISYKKAGLIVDTKYKELEDADLIRYILALLDDCRVHFKEAYQNGNMLAHIQYHTLRKLGCLGTLPSLKEHDALICTRLLSAMQLHILSGSKKNEPTQSAPQPTQVHSCAGEMRSEGGDNFEVLTNLPF